MYRVPAPARGSSLCEKDVTTLKPYSSSKNMAGASIPHRVQGLDPILTPTQVGLTPDSDHELHDALPEHQCMPLHPWNYTY